MRGGVEKEKEKRKVGERGRVLRRKRKRERWEGEEGFLGWDGRA